MLLSLSYATTTINSTSVSSTNFYGSLAWSYLTGVPKYALAASLNNLSSQQINDSFGNWSQFFATFPNLDTDSTDDLDTAKLDNGTIVRSHNTSWVEDNAYNTEAELTTLLDDDYVDVDEASGSANISCTGNLCYFNITCETITGSADLCDGSDATSSFDPSSLDYVNQSMFDNGSIVRSHNTTWVTNQISAGDSNLTYSAGVFNLARLDLAEFDNSVSAFITTAVSTLVNYFTKTEITNMNLYNGSFVNASITMHNASIKSYVDTQDSAQDECSEITGCVENALINSSVVKFTNITSPEDETNRIWNNGSTWFIKGDTITFEVH